MSDDATAPTPAPPAPGNAPAPGGIGGGGALEPLTPREAAQALRVELGARPAPRVAPAVPVPPPAPPPHDAGAVQAEPPSWAGKRLGQYRILERIGQGGMGTVFRAHDTSLDRTVALKVLFCDPLDGPKTAERFKREAISLARLSHPNLLHVYNVGSEAELHYFAMEMLEGATLANLLRIRGRMAPMDFLPLAGQLLSALHYIHRQGITHRDIKGSNIMVCGTRAVLMDFGLARDEHFGGMTSVGCVLGTPEYMPPEQAEGFSHGPPSDLYSFGVVMYEALSGGTPFTGRSALSILRQQMDAPPPRLETRVEGIDPRLANAVHRCLKKRPEERFPDCPALAGELAALLPTPELTQVASADASRATVLRPRSQDYLPGSSHAPPPAPASAPAPDAPTVKRETAKAAGAAGAQPRIAPASADTFLGPAHAASATATATATALDAPAAKSFYRRAWFLGLALGLAAFVLALLVTWWVRRPSGVPPGAGVQIEGLSGAAGREYRLVEFQAPGTDPERWTWLLEWKKPDGTWQREKVVGQAAFERVTGGGAAKK